MSGKSKLTRSFYFNITKLLCSSDLDKKNDGSCSYIRRLTRQVSMHTLIGFNELRLNVKLCDASLILDNGDTFPIHRSVMSGSSDYFRSVPSYIPITYPFSRNSYLEQLMFHFSSNVSNSKFLLKTFNSFCISPCSSYYLACCMRLSIFFEFSVNICK